MSHDFEFRFGPNRLIRGRGPHGTIALVALLVFILMMTGLRLLA